MGLLVVIVVGLALVVFLAYELIVYPAMNMTEPMKLRRPFTIRRLWN